MNQSSRRVGSDRAYTRTDLTAISFDTTEDLEDLDGAIGQKRSLDALTFAMRTQADGFNLFVLGPAGSHRHELVLEFLGHEAGTQSVAADWCYVNNFAETRKPAALELPPGRGVELRDDMDRFIAELRDAIPAAFDSEQYRNRVAEINQEYEDRHEAAVKALQAAARDRGLSVISTPQGFGIAPMRGGELLSDEQFDKLTDEEKQKTRKSIEEISELLRSHFEQLPHWQREHREAIRALNREITNLVIRQLMDQLLKKYVDFAEVVHYLSAVQEDVLENAADFHSQTDSEIGLPRVSDRSTLDRYKVNVIVDHSAEQSAPIVYEDYPSVQNLLGRVEHAAQFGALVTDFTMIRSGAVHRANGGYLILDAERILTEPLAWNALKRVLQAKEIRIESLGELLSLVSTVSLEPQPIPLDVKVILIGERLIYYLLCELDPDFQKLFKVSADLDGHIERTPENTLLYCRVIATLVRRHKLRPLSQQGVARVIEHAARMVGDAGRLSTRLQAVSDLLHETDYWSGIESAPVSGPSHVERAIAAQIGRQSRVNELMQDSIRRETILIDTAGERVGQVNGLSVISLGSESFGQPSRITATTRVGSGKIVDIERETELGGPLHSKGMLIVSSYMAARYAPDYPLSLGASLVFEQSYGGIEGDSASIAETCALLSSVAGLPLRQSLAVTGSMNQLGQAQAIGGVNEKVEGFFDVCNARGLTGDQGVLIPQANVKNLMLRPDVVEAIDGGRFHLYAISHVDEALELLTGVAAGERDAEGQFPLDTVNGRVESRLIELAQVRREFDRGNTDAGGGGDE